MAESQSPVTQLLSVIVGLAFTYLLLSLVCAAVNELIAWFFDLRANTLKKGIATMLGEHDVKTRWDRLLAWITLKTPSGPMVDAVYDHALVKGLAQGQPLPAYIPSRAFAIAILDSLRKRAAEKLTAQGLMMTEEQGPLGDAKEVKQLREAIDLLPNDQVKGALRSLLDRTVDSIEEAHKRIAAWYDDTMDRVSGWYKRRSQVQILLCSAIVTFALNADSIRLSKKLWSDRAFAAQVNAAARDYVDKHKDDFAKPAQPTPQPAPDGTQPTTPTPPPAKAVEDLGQSYQAVVEAGIPLGWQHETLPKDNRERQLFIFWKALGLLLTILALLQGAPFWFDILSSIVRSAGPKPQKQSELESES